MELEAADGPVHHGRTATETAPPGQDSDVTVRQDQLFKQGVFKRLARSAGVPLLVNVQDHALRVVVGGAKLASGRLSDIRVVRGQEEVAAVVNVVRHKVPDVAFNNNNITGVTDTRLLLVDVPSSN